MRAAELARRRDLPHRLLQATVASVRDEDRFGANVVPHVHSDVGATLAAAAAH